MASLVRWSFPTTIVFGAGALATLPDHGKKLGKHALVVTDAGVRKAGLVDQVTKTLTQGGQMLQQERPRLRCFGFQMGGHYAVAHRHFHSHCAKFGRVEP